MLRGAGITLGLPLLEAMTPAFAAVKEVALLDGGGAPLPTANLSLTTRQGGTYYTPPNPPGTTCSPCSALPSLFDGVYNAYGDTQGTLAVSGQGVPELEVPLLAGADVPRLGLPGRAIAVVSRFLTGG
jgi:hypothetical protein